MGFAAIDEAREEENDTESILLSRSINRYHISVQLTTTYNTLLHCRVCRGNREACPASCPVAPFWLCNKVLTVGSQLKRFTAGDWHLGSVQNSTHTAANVVSSSLRFRETLFSVLSFTSMYTKLNIFSLTNDYLLNSDGNDFSSLPVMFGR